MRTYIQPLKKSAEDEIKVRVDREVARGLKDYCEFLQSPQSYVVTEVLRKALRKDKAFTAWLSRRVASEPAAETASKSKRAARPPQPHSQSEEGGVFASSGRESRGHLHRAGSRRGHVAIRASSIPGSGRCDATHRGPEAGHLPGISVGLLRDALYDPLLRILPALLICIHLRAWSGSQTQCSEAARLPRTIYESAVYRQPTNFKVWRL